MENGSKGRPCVKITGGTEKLIVILFTTAITIIIVMTVINIAVAGIHPVLVTRHIVVVHDDSLVQ